MINPMRMMTRTTEVGKNCQFRQVSIWTSDRPENSGDNIVPTYQYGEFWAIDGRVQIRDRGIQKALGTLDSRDSLRSSVVLLPVVLASSGFAESTSPFQSARSQLAGRQKLARRSVLI